MMRLARAYDDGAGDERERHFARLATAVVKYWVCKRQPVHVAEALECLGGNGYVEESMLPRLYREAPLNSHLGGLGQRHLPRRAARDGPRARGRSTRSSPSSTPARGGDARLDAFVDGAARASSRDFDAIEARARRLVERMALALQGVAARAPRRSGRRRGVLRLAARRAITASRSARCRAGVDCAAIIERARPRDRRPADLHAHRVRLRSAARPPIARRASRSAATPA